MRHNFKASLEKGKQGEIKLMKLWPELQRTDGRSGDYILPSGTKVEIKSDFYDHDATKNFFIETWSDVDKKKPGGPTQALLHGCKYFVYYFITHDIAYIFDTEDLAQQLLATDLGTPCIIQNKTWATVGYKVPRAALKPIFILTKTTKQDNPCK